MRSTYYTFLAVLLFLLIFNTARLPPELVLSPLMPRSLDGVYTLVRYVSSNAVMKHTFNFSFHFLLSIPC